MHALAEAPAAIIPELHARRLGEGPATLMLHASGSSGDQWRPLLQTLGPRGGTALVVDLHGHGTSPGWPRQGRDTLAIDAEAAWRSAGSAESVHLVGHAYGGAVALQMALMQPRRVASLILYEPLALGLLRGRAEHAGALDEASRLAEQLSDWTAVGRLHGAARVFADYWHGGPVWERMDDLRRLHLALRMTTIVHHVNAQSASGWSRSQLQRLRMPTLLLQGGRTRAPASAVTTLLADLLPQAAQIVVAGAGHMGPLTHAAPVAALMAGRLRDVQASTARQRADRVEIPAT